MPVKKLAVSGLCATIALAVYSIEAMLPPLLPVPGIKMGLANVVTLLMLIYYKPGDAFCVLFVRILLAGIFGGQMISLLYSLSGGICCFMIMVTMNHFLRKKHLVMTSMGGALAHNTAQILMARVIIGSVSVYTYIPILMISGMITGAFTGFVAGYACRHLKKSVREVEW